MRKVIVKRLIFTDSTGYSHIGSEEYFGTLPDLAILYSVHEYGKTAWIGGELWTVREGKPQYCVTVDKFNKYKRTWWDDFIDYVRSI